ncbi:protein translocase subunit SecF [bacterium]|nr:protein translocase subunit SecF [bacterium]
MYFLFESNEMINFLKYRYVCFAVSSIFLLSGVAAYFYHGGLQYSVDFTGGTQVLLKCDKSVGSEQIKNALADNGWADSVVLEFGNNEVAVRVKEFSHDAQGLAQKIQIGLNQTLQMNAEILEANAVGAGVGGSLRASSLFALLFCLLVMLGYIAWRSWSVAFGVGAVVALLHDALATLALFAILQKEISPIVVSGLIALLGYSINDTIVIFSRIKENFGKIHGSSADKIVDVSINQTLRRTMLTSFSTLLTVAALFFLGGESLHTWSLVLLFGIVVGTYSSVYIASPVMLALRR